MADVHLSEFLSEAGRRSWAWGELDCFLFCADWVERVSGIDPAGEYRGAYTNQREARRLLLRNGGPVRFAGQLLARAGFVETDAPRIGDVGLVQAGALHRRERLVCVPVGAICVRPQLWAIKPGDGRSLAIGAFAIVKAWTFDDAHRAVPSRRRDHRADRS